jgi:hypothetical protein
MNARPTDSTSLDSIIEIVSEFLLTLPITLEKASTLDTMSTVSQVPQTKQTCSDEANVDHTTLAGNLGPKVSQCKLPTKIWSPSTLESQPIHTEDPRTEPHGRNFEYLYPATLGIADGITVPFAVMASLTVLNDRHIVVIGGLAELFAGALSMGLGQFMTALLKREHFLSEEAREKMEIESKPEEEEAEIHEILERYGVSDHVAHMVVDDLKANPLLYLQVIPNRMEFISNDGQTADGTTVHDGFRTQDWEDDLPRGDYGGRGDGGFVCAR